MTAYNRHRQDRRVRFGSFDLETYQLFLRVKQLPERELTYDWETDTYIVQTPARYAALLAWSMLLRCGHGCRSLVTSSTISSSCQCGIGCQALCSLARYGPREDDRALRVDAAGCTLDRGPCAHLVPTNELIAQHREAAHEFYGDELQIRHIPTREALAAWCQESGPDVGLRPTPR